MKKKMALAAILVILVAIFIYCHYIFGWMTLIGNHDTPKKYLSHVIAPKKQYRDDSLKVIKGLEIFLSNHLETFYSKVYDDSTVLSVDTIIYSPDFNKIAVLVVAKYPMDRREIPDERYKWYYNGFCYLGNREGNSIDLTSLDPSFGSHSKEKVIKSLEVNYFRLLATVKDVKGQPKYDYNIDDIRFWNSPIWKVIINSKQERIEFEKEKKEHPENVYEPR